MDAETRALLHDSLRRALAEATTAPAQFAARLTELGWDEVVADDRAAAWTALFDAKGEALAGVDALDLVLADELTVATGTAVTGAGAVVVLPPGAAAHPVSSLDGDGLAVRGFGFRAPTPGTAVVVPVPTDGGPARVVIGVDDGSLAWQPVAGLDPDLGLGAVTGRLAPAALTWLDDPPDGDPGNPTLWARLVAAGRWALAAELVGVARRMVASAVEYAGARVQYGRPIGTFQAVQHRLAEAHTATAGAAAAVAEVAGRPGTPGGAWAAVVAKALAGQACEQAGVEAQQVFGAIGFTWEHDLHRALRRGHVLDGLLGDWRALERHVGEELVATRAVPRVGSL
jgi:hypothetical protein